MGGDEEQQQQQDDSRSKPRARKVKSESNNRNGNSDKISRGAFLVVQNALAKVPESGYRPTRPLPDLEKGYSLRSKGPNNNNNPQQQQQQQNQNNNDGFVITQQLSPTSYSAIKSPGNNSNYFVRIELSDTAGCPKQLKREVAVLQDGSKASPENRKHFLKLVARGRIVDKISPFNYLIVPLCEKSLALPSRQFTHADAFRLSVCCFQAIHDLHALGFVHRNLKPSVFCLRTLQNHGEVRLYLTSFEYAYRFRKREGKETRSPKVLFKMKKAKFLPRSYHVSKEIVRKDDLESWLFILTHLFEPLCLNWHNTSPDMNMLSMKERFFCIDFDVEPFSRLPNGVIAIVRYLHKLEPETRPDYQLIGMLLAEICRKEKFPITGPFDFQSNKYADPKAISSSSNNANPNPAAGKQKASTALRRNKTAGKKYSTPGKAPGSNGFEDRLLTTDATAATTTMDKNSTATTSKKRKGKARRAPAAAPAPPPTVDEDPFEANVQDDQDDDQQQPPPPPVQKAKKAPRGKVPTSSKPKKKVAAAGKVRKRQGQQTRSIQQPEDEIPAAAATPTKASHPNAKAAQYALLVPAETQDPNDEEDDEEGEEENNNNNERKPTQKPDEDADATDGGDGEGQKDSKKESAPPIFSANKMPKPKQEDPNEEL